MSVLFRIKTVLAMAIALSLMSTACTAFAVDAETDAPAQLNKEKNDQPKTNSSLFESRQSVQPPRDGYCVILGAGRSDYVAKVAERTGCHIVVVDPDAGQWSHSFADAAKTSCSDGNELEPPLQLLWSINMPRKENSDQNRRPIEMRISGGRLFLIEAGFIHARNLYTGQKLWQKKTLSNQSESKPAQLHYLALPKSLYIMQPRYCERINPANGETEKRLRLPPLPGNSDPHWGWIGISDDVLLAASTPVALNLESGKRGKGQETSQIAKRVAASDMSIALVAFQRDSGKPLWSRSASLAFQHDAIVMGGDKIFCIDGLRRLQNHLLKDQGIFTAAAPTLYALDAKTGETIWEKPVEHHADQLAYSKEKDVLLQFSLESEAVAGENSSKLNAYDGSDGDLLWEKADQLKSRPVLCGGQAFIDGAVMDVTTGESVVWKDPIVKAERKFNLDSIRNGTIATSDLLFSGKEECIDLKAREGLLLPRLNALEDIESNVAGGGVLAVATASRVNAFGSRTGLPDWRYQLFQGLTASVQRVGINFGAAGDRTDTDGMLWLEKPAIHGRDPGLEVMLENQNARFYREPSESGHKLGWIGSSGVINPGAINIKLDYSPVSEKKVYRVKLFFQTPPSQKESYTTFDVLIQGEKVIPNLDVAWQAGGAAKMLVKEFAGIEAEESIRIELVPHRGEPFISGIALEME